MEKMRLVKIMSDDGRLIAPADIMEENRNLRQQLKEMETRYKHVKKICTGLKVVCLETQEKITRYGIVTRPVNSLPRLMKMKKGELVRFAIFKAFCNPIEKLLKNV